MISNFRLKHAIHPGRGRELAGICALLVALVFLVFGQTLHYDFVYDDTIYVVNNPVVQDGLTRDGVIQSLTYQKIDYWHPLTWISHMLDRQCYGLWAGGYHLTNILLHATAVVLLFLVLFQMTGALWRCAFVAAAWAIHPLRAESVAWISERKDVLSGVFFMLALGAYVRCVRQPSTLRRVLVVVVLALGLMSKNMLVTFPCVLLLLDFWPLGRLDQLSEFPRLVKEKIPLFALSVISCVITFQFPHPPGDDRHLQLWVRIQNTLISYCVYLRQSVWPAGLAADYPNPTHAFAFWQVAGSLALLGLLSAAAFGLRKRHPYLSVGWLWFIGMLVPVIGLVQISDYAHADRYTYLPQIGLWIAGTWMVADLAGEWRNRRTLAGVFAVVILCALTALGWRQTSYWRDRNTLWSRVLACDPSDPAGNNNMGNILLEAGKVDEAIVHYREAIRSDPLFALAYYNLGRAFAQQGRLNEAIAEYLQAARINSSYVGLHNNLGLALAREGRMKEAMAEYGEALRLDPTYPGSYNNLGNAMLQLRQTDEAIADFREAVRLDPSYGEAYNNLGNALVVKGRRDEAIVEYREALRIDPSYGNARYNLGNALFHEGQAGEAIEQLQEALNLQPQSAAYKNDLALMLSTAPQTSLRNGARALELATAANQATGGKDPMILRTLAAAYAETGEFSNAVQTAQKALQLIEAQSNPALAGALSREIKLYQEGRRFEGVR